MRRMPATLLPGGVALAQVQPANPGFEQGDVGAAGTVWYSNAAAGRGRG